MYRLACVVALVSGVLLAQPTSSPPVASVPLVNQLDVATVYELVNAIRGGADCREVSYDEPSRAFHVDGTDAQVAMAQWVVRQVDQPAGAPSPTQPLSYTYTGASAGEPGNGVVRMFFLAKTDTTVDGLDFLNILRTAADIQRVFPINSRKAIIVRAAPERVEAADWLIRQLDQPAQPGKMAAGELRLSGGEQANPRNRSTAMRVFWLANISTASGGVDMQNVMRTGADIQRVFPLASRQALVVRGEPERMELAEWFVKQLDQKPQPGRAAVSYDFADPVNSNNSRAIRILFLNHLTLQGAGMDLVMRIRVQTPISRVIPVSQANAIIVEGRPEQVAAAGKIVREADPAEN